MVDVPLRIKVEFIDRDARAGIERLKTQTSRALTPMSKAAIKARAALKKLGIEGDRAGKKIKKSMAGGAFAIRGIATEMESALRTLVFGLTAVTAAGGLLARQAVNMSAEFEVLKITFESLTGSITVADQLIRDMKEFAVRTPLQLRDIEEAGTVLLALGEAGKDVIPILNLLGQAATAMNKPLEQFVRVRNLLSQGVVLSRMLAPLGISRATLAEFGAGAGATGEQLVAAFDKALGKFEGLFEKTFNTIRGRMSNLKDELDVMFAAIGDPIRDILISTVDQITVFLGQIRTFFEVNKEAIEAAFKSIKESAEAFIAPVTEVLGKFFSDLRDNPAKIQELADAFVNLSKAATRLLIFGTVTVGLLKFIVAVTLLRIALPQLLATLGLSIKAVGGLGLAFSVLNPVALAITVAIGLLTAGIVIYNESLIRAKERSIELRTELEEQLDSLEAMKVKVDELASTYNKLKDSTQTNEEKFAELRNEMQLIINLHPEFLRQLGLTVTTSGQLTTAFGTVIDTWQELEGIWLHSDSSNAVTQINNVTNALNNLSRAEFMGARLAPWEFMLAITRGIGAVRELRAQRFEEQLPPAEMPDFVDISRFLQQFPGAAAAVDEDELPPGGAGRIRDEKRRTEIETIKWLRELAIAAERLIEESVRVSDNLLNFGQVTKTALEKLRGVIAGQREPLRTKEQLSARELKAFGDIEKLEKVSNEFIGDLARTLGDFLAQLGKTGGKADIGGFVGNLVGIGANALGASLFGKGGFATGGLFAKGAFLGGLGPGLVAGAVAGGVGFIANRLMGEEPLKIEQPVDIRIVDIETRLKNFFNFRNLDAFTYRSSFQLAFENGVY